ncbi:TerD family protein [Streptomyces sp. 6N223]|uniref:TerD family protein n=1 Tax=Streptomyces sp. 6N223 TaxID=3457412 RepID=UPI003FD61A45
MTHALEKGATVRIPSSVGVVRAVLRWMPGGGGAGEPDIDLSALLLGVTGRVRAESDLVFYNQPRHPSGLVRRLPKRRDAAGLMDTVEAELALLEPGVERVVLAASAEGGFRAESSRPRLVLHGAAGAGAATGPELAVVELAPEPGATALACGELSRTAGGVSGGGWEFRASGQGFGGGLSELAAAYGVSASSAPQQAPPPAQPARPAPAVPARPPAPAPSRPDPRRHGAYGYPQPDPAFTLPPQGPQFLPPPR